MSQLDKLLFFPLRVYILIFIFISFFFFFFWQTQNILKFKFLDYQKIFYFRTLFKNKPK